MKMFAFGVILIICTVLCLAVPKGKAKAIPLTVTYLTCPTENTEGEGELLHTSFWAIFSQIPKQDFRFEIKPALKLRLVKSDRIMAWVIDDYKQFRPSATYTCRFSSPNAFLYHGKSIKEVVWKIYVPEEAIITEVVPNLREGSMIVCPIDLFLPQYGDQYVINEAKKGSYKISLDVPFNAGVNGPPIEVQIKQYYTQIAKLKQRVINWISSKGQNPNELKINWSYNKY